MAAVKAVIELLAHNASYSQIRRELGVSKGFISKVAFVIKADGKTPEQFLLLSDAEIRSKVYPDSRKKRTEPNWEDVADKLQRKHMTLQLLYEDYCQNNPEKHYSYPSYCRLYADWCKTHQTTGGYCNLEHVPGDVVEIDFAGDPLTWVDPCGFEHKERLFVAALPYSGLFFVQVFENETQPSWIQGTVEALAYFGCAPRNLLMDNAKALVRHADWSVGDIQPMVEDMCRHYGMNALTCRVRKPRDKNRVEASVCNAERWIIAKLELANGAVLAKDRTDLKALVRKRLDEVNLQAWRGPGRTGSRRSCFEEEERACMNPLPPHPYVFTEWKVLTVDKGHCIRMSQKFGGHRYSVPASYIGKKVQVKIDEQSLEIFDHDSGQPITTHKRQFNETGQKTFVNPEHWTPQEKRTRLNGNQWVSLFVDKLGIDAKVADTFVANVMGDGQGVAGRNICGAVLRLRKSFSASVIERAMAKLNEAGLWRIKALKAQCESIDADDHYEQTVFNNEPDTQYTTASHGNIRNDYE